MYAESLDLPSSSILVVQNGVRPPEGQRSPLRSELRIGEDEILAVAVGNLYEVKGHAVLIQALGRLQRARPDHAWRCAIAGRGDEEENLRALAGRESLTDRVHFLGYRSDVADILAAADLFVMPSYSEGLPLALLEAMFAGRAVVASDVGGIPELIRDREEGLLVPPGDAESLGRALEELFCDSDLRHSLGMAARQRAEARYTIEAMTDAYETLYATALDPMARLA
jgi:glycosyltransferase involved in cell wall biosynthesis